MPWFYVDDGFSDSKPVLNMPDRYRLAACGLWVLAGSWSAKEETDGLVPNSKLRQLGARPNLVDVLTKDGPMSASLCMTVPGGIQFKSWAKWQKTREELNERRRENAERQRNCRANKRKGRNAVTSQNSELSHSDSGVTHIVTDDDRNADVTRDPHARVRRPDPTRPDPTPNGQSERGTHASSDTAEPPRHCPRHMPSGTLDPCAACKHAREQQDEWRAHQSAEEIRRIEAQAAALRAQRQRESETRADAIAACTLCDPDGYRNGVVCNHDPGQDQTNRAGMAAVRAALGKPHQLDDEDPT